MNFPPVQGARDQNIGLALLTLVFLKFSSLI